MTSYDVYGMADTIWRQINYAYIAFVTDQRKVIDRVELEQTVT